MTTGTCMIIVCTIVLLSSCQFNGITNAFSTTKVQQRQANFPIRQYQIHNERRPVKIDPTRFTTLYFSNNGTTSLHESSLEIPKQRFERTADTKQELDELCILTIDNKRYNLTTWAKAHPGGVRVLQRFHNKDASNAFHNAAHSKAAYGMLKEFEIIEDVNRYDTSTIEVDQKHIPTLPRWRRKLFTMEDPIGIHKYLGVFVLLNFIFRYGQMYFGDPSAGLGTRLGKGPSWIPLLCLVMHGLLSTSSLIFDTVPKERVVGMPMIWQEYRVHNILFGIRSVLTGMICSLSIRFSHRSPIIRPIAIWASCLVCLTTMIGADIATSKLRANDRESTTATMPYWDGCTKQRQKQFKVFYAYSQFMATFACFMMTNPAFSLAVLLAIQLASLLMTLVRKGLLTTRGYHMIYTATLIAPYFVAFRSVLLTKTLELPIAFTIASVMFIIRRHGVSKYMLWIPMMAARIAFGDKFLLSNDIW